MSELMVCGCIEQFGDGAPALKVGTNRPLVLIQGSMNGITQDEVWAWLREAHARWGSVCDWQATRIRDIQEAAQDSVIQLVTFADLGAGGVLADQVLPYQGGQVLRMRINVRINWRATDGQMSAGTVDPIRTICHETGHFQGHTHLPQGAPLELMEPIIQQAIIAPQPTEAQMSAYWFGKPQSQPPPTPQPPGSPHTLVFQGGMLTFSGQGTFDGKPF